MTVHSANPKPEAESFKPDVWERTKGYGGSPAQAMNRRLFMQLMVFNCDPSQGSDASIASLAQNLEQRRVPAVVYEDLNNPFAIGLLTWSEDAEHFVRSVRPCFAHGAAASLKINPDFTMIGRTYSTGYESDLEFWLLNRPVQTVLNEKWRWAVWYPLRRSGAFARLEGREQGSILREHADIGKAYGEEDLAHDVRLACHGLDQKDNEFVIGLIGKDLHPLSHVVQSMRKTRQTSEYISQMGPFFVGRAVRQIA
jgi:Chlorite dismutase